MGHFLRSTGRIFWPEQFIFALVVVDNAKAAEPRYVRNPFTSEPDSGAVSANNNLKELLARSTKPQ